MHDNSELALGTSTSTINTRHVTGAAGPPEHSSIRFQALPPGVQLGKKQQRFPACREANSSSARLH